MSKKFGMNGDTSFNQIKQFLKNLLGIIKMVRQQQNWSYSNDGNVYIISSKKYIDLLFFVFIRK